MNPAIFTAESTLTDVARLGASLTGSVVTPLDAEYDVARQAWNLAVDQQPIMVALPETAADVQQVVRYAADRGLRVAPQGTGHNAHPFGSLEDTILLKTARMIGVQVNARERYARVGAGALWQDVVGPAGDAGLTALSGSSPDVGVVGYSLGGGISWIGRTYGLAANNIRAVEMVTGDGELVRVDAEHHEDLFWAIRGGGGSFGVVTALETELKPFAEIYAGMMAFPMERADEVLHAWREWHATVPETMTTVARLLRVPPLPDIPEPVRGRSLVTIEAFHLGGEAEGAELVRPMRELGPELDGICTMPTSALVHVHMDPEHPVPGIGDHMLLDELPAAGVDAMIEAAGPDVESPLLAVELRQLGGALARRAPDSGALGSIDAAYSMFTVGMAMTPEMGAAVDGAIPSVKAAFAPYDSGREYLNFAEKATDPRRFYTDDAWTRLTRVKAEYDPDETFRANHEIPPAA